ncbi:MAG: helix-turn-helix transcriptional regulator [Peptococcaceae bacterium]|nr:helix-turn-helix transcriptional regulator [Peptococcaceae bacterium]
MDYGQKIRELRKGAGLSANTLAKKVDLDPTTIYKMEAGVSKPSLDALERICAALGVTLAEFFTDEDPSKDEAHRLYAECGDLPKEAVERVAELIALYRIKYKVEKDSQK